MKTRFLHDFNTILARFVSKNFRLGMHAEFVFSGPLKAKTEVEKCSYLMIWVGEKGRNIYSTWPDFSADDKKELSKYYGRFENYVKPRSNEVYNRYKFQTRSQNDPESFDQFVTELKIADTTLKR